jgi:hypothetical protein
MAQEIQNAIAADGGAGLAPGSAETPPAETPPAAGPSTPETGQQQGPPETIPYARFKEVNDRLANLKGYEELAQYGYDPDSLGRLAAFEAQYVQDPIGTVSKMIDDLDLPQELKEAFAQHATSGGAPANTPPTAGGGTQSEASGEQPAVPPDVQEAVRWVAEQKQAAEAQAAEEANSAVLDSVVAEWDRLDKESELTTPEHVKLSFISSAAATGGFSSPEQLGKMAWEANRAYRDSILGSAVNSGRPGGAPSALPGGGPAAPTPQAYRDIADASKQAIADIQAGRLPQIGGA